MIAFLVTTELTMISRSTEFPATPNIRLHKPCIVSLTIFCIDDINIILIYAEVVQACNAHKITSQHVSGIPEVVDIEFSTLLSEAPMFALYGSSTDFNKN